MSRWLALAPIALLISGCASFSPSLAGDPSRLVIGVSAARPAAAGTSDPEGAVAQNLNWKVSQLCTHGFERVKQDFEPAEQDSQLVDWQLRCRPYHLAF